MEENNRRRERRIRSRGPVQLMVAGQSPISGKIYDISQGGISVEAEGGIAAGLAVEIEGEGFVMDGVVRHCRQEGETFRIGIVLESRPVSEGPGEQLIGSTAPSPGTDKAGG
ncbi:MAG TPA: PilZ domain-containing protein [Bryobacteraceae bacterium]|nr:PilZ domain-containing protein [Bryobacteraceae bacterium]